MAKIDIAVEFEKYVRKKFGAQVCAAEHYGVTASFISQIIYGKVAPTKYMLKDMGYKKVQQSPTYVKVKDET